METIVNKTRLSLIRGDITAQETDAIVNAANSSLMGGSGVDGAIHRAGGPQILEECKRIIAQIGHLPTGEAVITTGGNLKARHVIHTVGPVWHGGKSGEPQLLASSYRESLKLAVENGLKSISFPSISTGAFGYPLKEASKVAVGTVMEFLKADSSLEVVVFVLFDQATFAAYSQALQELAGL